MLVFSLDDCPIPATILGMNQVDRWTAPLAELARDIGGNDALLALVQDFVST